MTAETNGADHELSSSGEAPRNHRRRRWLVRLSVGVLLTLTVFIAGLPTIVAATGLYRILIDRAAADRQMTASAESASLRWSNPVVLHDVQLQRDDGNLSVSTSTISTEKSLFDLLWSPASVKAISLDRPAVVLKASAFSQADDSRRQPHRRIPPLKAFIRGGSFEIRADSTAQPLVLINEVSFTARMERSTETDLLVVERVKVFDRRLLTPELCDRGLQFIAPVLSDAAIVTGQLTLDLNELQIPIGRVATDDRNRLMRISGQLMLHNVETGLRNPVLAQIASILSSMTGGHFATVKVAEDALVDFRVEQGRVHHQGLTLLIPEISDDLTIKTNGWVDLEENVDIRILVNLSGLTPRVAILTDLTRSPLELHMTGTLSQPKISFPEGRDLLDELANRLTGDDGNPMPGSSSTAAPQQKPDLPTAITNLVGSLVGEKQKKPDTRKTTHSIIDLIRAIQDEKPKTPPDK
ncbi:hypothetical protein GC176_12550 [bacterium]|nr:hypothetical protein [bacterium]